MYSDVDEYGFVEILNKFESPRFGFTSGIVSRYQFSSRFALESGLQFSDKGYKYGFSKYDLEFNNGFPEEDDPAMPEKITISNHYYYLGIPVRLNYYVLLNEVKLFISAGVSNDFFVKGKSKTKFEFPERNEIHTNQMGNEDFNKVKFTGLIGFGAEKEISNRLQFCFEPIFRYSFAPVIDASMKGYLYSFGANFIILYQ